MSQRKKSDTTTVEHGARTGPRNWAAVVYRPIKHNFEIGDPVRIVQTGELTIVIDKTSWGDYLLDGHPDNVSFPASALEPIIEEK